MSQYKHLFFDLDCTLWDYQTNSAEALLEIFKTYQLQRVFNQFDNFRFSFVKHNEDVWKDYYEGKIHKDVLRILRFDRSLNDYGVSDNELATKLNKDFMEISPRKTKLISGAIEVLEYLKSRHYQMYIITNGFPQVQEIKTKNSGLSNYFLKMFTPENIGSVKPHRAIFEHAIKSANARKVESLMIGDELEVDIIGARNFGIDQVYFNPKFTPHSEKVTYEIANLSDVKAFL